MWKASFGGWNFVHLGVGVMNAVSMKLRLVVRLLNQSLGSYTQKHLIIPDGLKDKLRFPDNYIPDCESEHSR